MKKKHTNLDSLLGQNASDQLSMVDWDRLHSDIQQRLDHAGDINHNHSVSPNMLRWAIGISAAAAMVIAVFIFQHDSSNGVELPSGQRAAVKLTEPDTLAKVKVTESSGNRYASVVIEPSAQKTRVSFSQSNRQIAQCDVTIIDQNGHTEKENDRRPSWVIIIASQAEELENETDQEQADIACLL